MNQDKSQDKNQDKSPDENRDKAIGNDAKDDVFAMLQDAVNTARNHQVKDVEELRKMLIEKHPKQELDRECAANPALQGGEG